MMQISLSKSDFDFLSRYMELSSKCVKSHTTDENKGIVKIQIDDYSNFQIMMNFDIVSDGMDNQDTVNELGKRMYQIYDEVLYQKNI